MKFLKNTNFYVSIGFLFWSISSFRANEYFMSIIFLLVSIGIFISMIFEFKKNK